MAQSSRYMNHHRPPAAVYNFPAPSWSPHSHCCLPFLGTVLDLLNSRPSCRQGLHRALCAETLRPPAKGMCGEMIYSTSATFSPGHNHPPLWTPCLWLPLRFFLSDPGYKALTKRAARCVVQDRRVGHKDPVGAVYDGLRHVLRFLSVEAQSLRDEVLEAPRLHRRRT